MCLGCALVVSWLCLGCVWLLHCCGIFVLNLYTDRLWAFFSFCCGCLHQQALSKQKCRVKKQKSWVENSSPLFCWACIFCTSRFQEGHWKFSTATQSNRTMVSRTLILHQLIATVVFAVAGTPITCNFFWSRSVSLLFC